MMGQGLGPGGRFSLWDRKEKRNRAARDAMAKTIAQEVNSIAGGFGERVWCGFGGVYMGEILLV
jgi:hypothetical protein